MSTLTETASFSKKASIWVVIGIVALVFLMIFLGVAGNIKNALFPPPPLPATVAFGKLPAMDLSEGYKAPGGISYSIETVSGDLPVLVKEAKAFAIAPGVLSFGALEDVKTKASQNGFSGDVKEINGTKVEFTDPQESGRILTMDKTTGNFMLTSNYATDQSIITSRPESLESAIKSARSFFGNFGISELEFPAEKIRTQFLRIDGNILSKVASLSAANLVQVDFLRADIDKLPVIWPKDMAKLATALVSERKVVAADLNLLPIRKNSFATYPLKGTAAAFSDLKDGRGAFVKPIKTNSMIISDVKLGYVESSKNELYLEPVYLFYSSDEQIGYVPAVDAKWIK